MGSILFTGCTGFLGRFLAAELLKQNKSIIFIVRNKTHTPEDRVLKSLSFVDTSISKKFRKNFKVIAGDITKINFGLDEDALINLRAENISEVWHTAGAVSFDNKERDNIIRINTQGTRNVLDFIKTIKPIKLHYISTAFVNNGEGNILEDHLRCNKTFNNPYEESKYMAEQLVGDFKDKNTGVKVFIYRPSIIVGHSESGKICNFTGYYRYMRTFQVIKKSLLNGSNRQSINNNETVRLPINVPGNNEARINIITVDYAVDLMVKLSANSTGGTYHITHQNPPQYKLLLKHSLASLGIAGPSVMLHDSTSTAIRKIEKYLARGIQDYLPYISGKPFFDQNNVVTALGSDYYKHDMISEKLVNRLISYAVAKDFKGD